ncbi:MAG: hypothetical protein J6Q54_08040 [Oscillospiraceae bacterium]|nr:hypothetical protein [Oscillospiraceae bacterium]
MEEKENAKKTTVKNIILIVVIVIVAAISLGLFMFDLYRFPLDSLTNYPNTQWECDALGLSFFVDDAGNITGFLKDGTQVISLDVVSRSATTYHSNYIACSKPENDSEAIFLHCFYKQAESGIFYVTVAIWDSAFGTDVVKEIKPYKFVQIQ